jgi:magnesium transporter
MDAVIARWAETPELLRQGSGALVYGLIDYVVDGHFDTIQEIDDELERLEDVLFDERTTDRAFQRGVYGLRKDLVRLRRVVLPMREVVNGLLRHSPTSGALGPWYDDLYDHVLRASEWTESLRDMITSLFETNLSLQDSRLNTIMKKLAGWAAIIAVPTLITSWYGQNIPYPGYDTQVGLYVSIALIVVCTVALYAVFKARDWL